MKLAFFSPYGERGNETGVLYLLARYLNSIFPEVVQLRCSGSFSVCDRDAEQSWRRSFTTCFSCMGESGRLARWSGITALSTSSFLLSTEAERTRRWALTLKADAIAISPYGGTVPFELCRNSFLDQTGKRDLDITMPKHVDVARRLVLSSARMITIGESFGRSYRPDLVFVVNRKDALTESFMAPLRREKFGLVVFEWDSKKHVMKIRDERSSQEYISELFFTDVETMRPDEKTWPAPLVAGIDEILEFLGLRTGQLALPLAR